MLPLNLYPHPPALVSFVIFHHSLACLLSSCSQAVQNILQASIIVSDAIAPDTGPRTAESETLLSHSPTEAVSIIRAAPHLLSPDQEDSMTGHPNISGNDAPFDEFIEVINDCEHEV